MKGLLLLAETAIPLGGGRRLVLTGGSLGWFWGLRPWHCYFCFIATSGPWFLGGWG